MRTVAARLRSAALSCASSASSSNSLICDIQVGWDVVVITSYGV
jgi:hypothetical protein